MARVDTEILAAVRAQSSSGGRARQDLGAAKATIEELFTKIRDIQRKAEQSELMVQEICRCERRMITHVTRCGTTRAPTRCLAWGPVGPSAHSCCRPVTFACCLNPASNRDIKKLDYAKKHLTATITALRRLSMLINAVGAFGAAALFQHWLTTALFGACACCLASSCSLIITNPW